MSARVRSGRTPRPSVQRGSLHDTLIQVGAAASSDDPLLFELMNAPADDFERVLGMILVFAPNLFLQYPEDPDDWEMSGEWPVTGPGIWRVPATSSAAELLSSYLEPGNWRCYAAGSPIDADLPDLFRAPTPTIRAFLQDHDLEFVADAWHDNTAWRIALRS